MMTPTEFEALLASEEDEHLEFKAAQKGLHFDDVCRYCSAMANERGGRLILGVTDKRPRRIVGTGAFGNLQDTKNRLLQALDFRIDGEEIRHSGGRVVVLLRIAGNTERRHDPAAAGGGTNAPERVRPFVLP